MRPPARPLRVPPASAAHAAAHHRARGLVSDRAHALRAPAASGEAYTLQPETPSFSRWQKPARQWEPRSAFVLELLHKIENILDDRSFFDSMCAASRKGGVDSLSPQASPRSDAAAPRLDAIDKHGFLRLLRSADIVGEHGGMVDEQYAMDVFMQGYKSTGARAGGTQGRTLAAVPRIGFDVYQHVLWQIGSHAAKMDMKALIPEADVLDLMGADDGAHGEGDAHERVAPGSPKATRFEVERQASGSTTGARWVSPRRLNETRRRTPAVPNSKVAVPGPGMYMKHLFSPFPNQSIFPGGHSSRGGTKGWTWGTAEQRQFVKNTLQEIGQSPGPAAYGDNALGMQRAQIGYGKGQLPGAAKHAILGTAERELSVAHATVAGMEGGITCELLNGVPQIRRPMLRKGDRRFAFSDVSDVLPTQQQLAEARRFLEYMFQQENVRKQAPPASLVRTVRACLFVATRFKKRLMLSLVIQTCPH